MRAEPCQHKWRKAAKNGKGKNGTRAAVQKKPRADILNRGPYSTTRTAQDDWTGRAVSRLLVPRWTRLRVELTGKMEPLAQDHQKVWDSHMPGCEAPADGRKQGADSSSSSSCCSSKGGSRKRVAVPHGRMRDGSNRKERSQVVSMGAAKKNPGAAMEPPTPSPTRIARLLVVGCACGGALR